MFLQKKLTDMEDFRSRSCGEGRRREMQASPYGINGMQDLRCYSTSHAYTTDATRTQIEDDPNKINRDVKLKKGKFGNNGSSSSSWGFTDPDLRRKRRVASYKVYTVEGKLKGSLKKSLRWIKDRCNKLTYGW